METEEKLLSHTEHRRFVNEESQTRSLCLKTTYERIFVFLPVKKYLFKFLVKGKWSPHFGQVPPPFLFFLDISLFSFASFSFFFLFSDLLIQLIWCLKKEKKTHARRNRNFKTSSSPIQSVNTVERTGFANRTVQDSLFQSANLYSVSKKQIYNAIIFKSTDTVPFQNFTLIKILSTSFTKSSR